MRSLSSEKDTPTTQSELFGSGKELFTSRKEETAAQKDRTGALPGAQPGLRGGFSSLPGRDLSLNPHSDRLTENALGLRVLVALKAQLAVVP